MAERPTGREKKVTGEGKKIKRRGDGLGTGPVGSGHIGNEEEIDARPEGSGDDDRDLGTVIQGLNTLSQLTGGGSGHSGGSGGSAGDALGALGQLLGGSGGQSGGHSGGSSYGQSGYGNSGGSGNLGSGLGALGQLLGGSSGGNGGSGSGGGGGYGGGGQQSYTDLNGGSSGGSGKKKSPIFLIIILALLLFGGGGGLLSGLFGGGGSGSSGGSSSGSSSGSSASSSGIDLIQSVLGGGMGNSFSGGSGGSSPSGNVFNGWLGKANVGQLNTNVDPAAAPKRTVIKGGGKDTVTIMIYLCGTDLESRSSMATADLNEMLQSGAGDNINIIVLTGGCKNWRNNVISSQVNQIYQVSNGKLTRLENNYGTNSMSDPDYLAKFIKYCAKNFPANRNELILWDHGGGSIAGYCYDEKHLRSGAMDLAEIKGALAKGGVKFDFIGFDACLMGTVENGLMLSEYADYMIASEESEPGVGWYYVNWLKKLDSDTSMSTLNIGKNIADDFTAACKKTCRGQSTTLSVVDLAELSATAPKKLSAFSAEASKMITATKEEAKESASYKTVATARTKAREFARGQGIDQVDLIHLAKNLDTKAAKDLAETLLGAIKYNQTSADMTNAYGLSIYFPYQRTRNVDAAAKVYKEIGMNSDYTKCIKQFAKMETGGQAAYGGSAAGSPLGSLFSLLGGSGSSGSQQVTVPSSSVSAGDVSDLLGTLLGGRSMIDGLDKSNTQYLKEDSLSNKELAEYVADNYFDQTALSWEKDGDTYKIKLPEEQWDLVTDLTLNMFYDDGEGFIDLGHDNVFEFDEDGALIGENDETWLAVDDMPVAYYYDYTVGDKKDYRISGHIPVLLNGQKANLIVVFTDEDPDGVIAGATYLYDEDDTEVVAKNVTKLKKGDKIDFIADFYSYNGKYEDSYMIGDQYVVDGDPVISNVRVGEDTWAMYRFTDIYHQDHFSEAIPK